MVKLEKINLAWREVRSKSNNARKIYLPIILRIYEFGTKK